MQATIFLLGFAVTIPVTSGLIESPGEVVSLRPPIIRNPSAAARDMHISAEQNRKVNYRICEGAPSDPPRERNMFALSFSERSEPEPLHWDYQAEHKLITSAVRSAPKCPPSRKERLCDGWIRFSPKTARRTPSAGCFLRVCRFERKQHVFRTRKTPDGFPAFSVAKNASADAAAEHKRRECRATGSSPSSSHCSLRMLLPARNQGLRLPLCVCVRAALARSVPLSERGSGDGGDCARKYVGRYISRREAHSRTNMCSISGLLADARAFS